MRALSGVAAVCIFATTLVAADNPFVGTWRMNTDKSRGTPGTVAKEATVTFEEVGDEMKRTVKGVNADGQVINTSSTIAWDGEDHKVMSPDGPPMMVAVSSVDDNTIDIRIKAEDGSPLMSGRAVVSGDGKTMTVNLKGQDPKGRKVENVEVFDKQ